MNALPCADPFFAAQIQSQTRGLPDDLTDAECDAIDRKIFNSREGKTLEVNRSGPVVTCIGKWRTPGFQYGVLFDVGITPDTSFQLASLRDDRLKDPVYWRNKNPIWLQRCQRIVSRSAPALKQIEQLCATFNNELFVYTPREKQTLFTNDITLYWHRVLATPDQPYALVRKIRSDRGRLSYKAIPFSFEVSKGHKD